MLSPQGRPTQSMTQAVQNCKSQIIKIALRITWASGLHSLKKGEVRVQGGGVGAAQDI